jgi:anti-sigma regulatory factor (Ser/Thr protein kinase)
VTPGLGHHNLFAYDDDSALVDRVAPFLAAGLAAREAVVFVVDPRKRAVLCDALGALADRVSYIDRDGYYTRPEAALAGYDAYIRRRVKDGAARVRVFGELPLCRTREESDTWIRYEALLNPAFAHHPVPIVCGLDAREQPDFVLEGSWETHPRTMSEGWPENGHYHDPAQVVRARTPAPDDVRGLAMVPAHTDARTLRRRLVAEMAAARVRDAKAQDMLRAVGEVVANAHRHGGGVRAVRAGRAGKHFVCEVSDHGAGLDDPLAGYLPPHQGHAQGAGLWVVRQLTDRLDMISTSRGLTARLWIDGAGAG